MCVYEILISIKPRCKITNAANSTQPDYYESQLGEPPLCIFSCPTVQSLALEVRHSHRLHQDRRPPLYILAKPTEMDLVIQIPSLGGTLAPNMGRPLGQRPGYRLALVKIKIISDTWPGGGASRWSYIVETLHTLAWNWTRKLEIEQPRIIIDWILFKDYIRYYVII